MFQINEVKPNVFRGNLLNENDINAYIQSYSIKTKTSWCIFSSKKSTRYVCRLVNNINFFWSTCPVFGSMCNLRF